MVGIQAKSFSVGELAAAGSTHQPGYLTLCAAMTGLLDAAREVNDTAGSALSTGA